MHQKKKKDTLSPVADEIVVDMNRVEEDESDKGKKGSKRRPSILKIGYIDDTFKPYKGSLPIRTKWILLNENSINKMIQTIELCLTRKISVSDLVMYFINSDFVDLGVKKYIDKQEAMVGEVEQVFQLHLLKVDLTNRVKVMTQIKILVLTFIFAIFQGLVTQYIVV